MEIPEYAVHSIVHVLQKNLKTAVPDSGLSIDYLNIANAYAAPLHDSRRDFSHSCLPECVTTAAALAALTAELPTQFQKSVKQFLEAMELWIKRKRLEENESLMALQLMERVCDRLTTHEIAAQSFRIYRERQEELWVSLFDKVAQHNLANALQYADDMKYRHKNGSSLFKIASMESRALGRPRKQKPPGHEPHL